MRSNRQERTRTWARRAKAFTLIELLLVMGVIGVLLVMAVGAYQNIGRATQVDTAVTQLKFTMQLARQWAVTQRQPTWIIFPMSRPVASNRIEHNNGVEVATNVNFRAYGVYAEPHSGDAEMIREWSYLPTGVLFDRRAYPTKNVFRTTGDNRTIPNQPPWHNDLRGQPAIGFTPSGALSRGDHPETFISEGFIAPGASATQARLTYIHGPTGDFQYHLLPSTQQDFVLHSIQVYRLTGLPQITRYGEE